MLLSPVLEHPVLCSATSLLRSIGDLSKVEPSKAGDRVSLGFTLLPSLLYAALVLRLPESPRYLLRKGRRERALQSSCFFFFFS